MWAVMKARLFLCLLVCLFCGISAQEGYVRLDSFDLDLDSGALTLRFSRDVNAATFDPTIISFTDDDGVVRSFYQLTGGTVTAVDDRTLSVSLVPSDVTSLVAVPGLCLNTFTCHIAYTLELVEASNGDFTLPGVLRVTNFVPYPLFLDDFALDMNTGALRLNFNKNVSAHNVDPTAVTLMSDLEGSQTHCLLWAECDEDRSCTDAPSITIYLSQDDQNYLKQNTLLCTSVIDTFMSFESSVIIDLGGYNVKIVNPGTSNKLQATDYTQDTTRPELVSFNMDVDNATFYLQFSEAVDADTFDITSAGQLVLKNPVADNFTVDFFGTNWYLNGSKSISTVIVLVAEEVMEEVIHILYRGQAAHSLLDSSGGLVQDWNGNSQAPTTANPVVNLDGLYLLTLMADYPFVFDRASHAFVITFPCEVPFVYDASNVELLNDHPYKASRIYPMSDEYYYGDGNTFAYFLPDELTREIAPLGDVAKVMANTFLRLKEPFCGETGQLVVRGNVEITSDIIHLVAFTMDMDQLKVQLTFDNLLVYNSPVDPSLVKIQKSNESAEFSVPLSSSTKWKIYEWRLDFFLEPNDVDALRDQGIARDITTSHMSVQSDVVYDLYGRNVEVIPETGAIQAERYIPGSLPEPTTLDAFTFNCTSGLLSLAFSQRVYTKTFDLTQLWLENERGERVAIWKGTYAVEYTDSPVIQLDPEAMEFISGRLGFLVNPVHIYLGFTENLVYDINDNLLNASNYFLTNSPNGVACRCHNGYQLTVNQSYCIDTNECDDNNGGCSDMCTNAVGSYNCSCPLGFWLEEDMHTCVDINECLENISGCNQTCINDPGSYHCECDTNEYVLLADRHSCGIIEHCDRDNGHILCDQGCVDDYGTYRCVCMEGYRLDSDQHSCSDIDECMEGTSGCAHVCTNSDGSYSCSCMSGYYLGDDLHTCFDNNECIANNGNCEHYCTNFNGSHECSCREGYTLEGEYQCTPDPCDETLVAPQYGSVMCNGPDGPDLQATDQSCVFSCEPGFYVEGSPERVCLLDHTWSGDPAYCERLRCPRLFGFEDASVVLPCDNAYESSCQINCLPDYFKWDVNNDTVTCVVQSEAENIVGWTARPVCIERQPCLPNPCLHEAECTELETVKGGMPNCHCSGTGYRGDSCEVGVVSIPSLPLLTVGETHVFTVSAKPDIDLTVEFDSKLLLTPKVLTFTRWVTEMTVNVTPSSAGVYTVKVKLSGTNAYRYETPPDMTVVVQSAVPIEGVDEILSPGCCSNKSESVHSCLGTSSTITFYSTCHHQTHLWEDGARILEGTSFTSAGGLSLPLSLSSVLMQSSGARGISFQMSPYESEDGTSQCTPCRQQECSTSKWECSCYDPAPSLAYYLQQESLAKTYLQNIAPLLPSWLKLEAVGSDRLYDDLSYRVELVDSEDLLKIPQCRGFFPTKNVDFGTYSVLVYSGTFRVTIGEDTVTHTPSVNDAFCVAVNLCEGKESPVYISLPTDFGFEQFGALDRLSMVGWKLEKVAGLIVRLTTPLEYYWEKADLIMNAEVSCAGTQGGTSLDLSFNGVVRLNTTTPLKQLVSDNEASGMSIFLDGSTEAVLNANGHLLHLRDLEAHTEITHSGPPTVDTKTTGLPYTRHNISLTLSQWMTTDKDNIFNRVLSDGGRFNTPVTIDVTLESSGQFRDVCFHTSGHKLLSGGFPFDGMQHSIYLMHQNSSLFQQSGITVVPSSSNIAVVSRPKAPNTLPTFWFLKLNGEKNEPIMLNILNMVDNSIKGWTLGPNTAVASLFSQRFPVQLQMSEESFKFEVTANLFGVTDAKVSAEGMAGESGQALLRVSGSLERGEISRSIEEQAIAHLEEVQEGMEQRADMAQRALNETIKMKDAIEPQVSEAADAMLNASQLYDESRRTRQRAEIEYHSHNVRVTLETRHYESTQLYSYLADLCTLKESCVKEMASKVVCQECDLQVQTNRRAFGEISCSRKRTLPEEVSQLVWEPVDTGVEGPEVNTISCDPSIPSYWEYPNFGCTVIAVPEKSRYVSSPTLHQVNHTDFVEREVEYTCNSAWEQESQWVMDHYCCEVQETALLHNHTCLGRNVACRLARSQAYQVYSAVPNAIELFSTLDDLLQKLTLARLKESEAYERYQAASHAHGQLSYFKEQIQHLLRHREEQVDRLHGRIIPSSDNGMDEQPLSVDEIQFDLLVESRMSATIPLTILFSLPNSSNHVMVFDFHFSSIAASTAAAAQSLYQSVLNSTESTQRMNASSIPLRNDSFSISTSGSTDFDSYCQDLQQVTSFVRYLSSSLERSADHYSSSVVGVEGLKTDLIDRLYSVKEWHNSGMWMMQNDSCNSSACGATATSEVSYEAEVTHFEDLVMTIITASEELVYSAEERASARWLLDMEEEVGRIMASYGCQGLVDCALTAVEVLEQILEVAGGTVEGVELLGDIPAAKEDLTSLALSRDVGVGEMRELLKKMESILQSSLDLDFWCELTPDVSVGVSHESPVRNGTSMEYQCSCTSNFPSLFQWLKDGSALPGETRPTLVLPNVTVESAGEYTCVVWTHKGEQLETTARLVVHQYPELTLQPMNDVTVFPEEGAVFFRCNASGVPAPSWQWYFRAPDTNISERMQLENETSSELIILPPSRSREGWYYCEACNDDNCENFTACSDGVYLRVLESSVADIAVPAVVTLFDSVDKQEHVDEETPVPSPRSQTANYVSRSKELSELSQNLTSVIFTEFSLKVVLAEADIDKVYDNGTIHTIKFVISSVPLIPNDNNKPEETFAEIETARMEWLDGIERVMYIAPNVDYGDLGISYDEVRSAEVDQSSMLVRCSEGQEVRRDTNLFCVGCAPGTFQSFAVEQLDSSSTLAYPTCASCPLGHYQPYPSQTECLPCPAGTSTPLLGQTSCQLCRVAEYQDEVGQVFCKECPVGYVTETEGSNSSSNCYCDGAACISLPDWPYIVICVGVLFAVIICCCCCCVVVCCVRCRLHRGKYRGPHRLEDIWGNDDVEMEAPIMNPSAQSTPKEVRGTDMSHFLGLDATGQRIQADWQDMVESGISEGGDDIFINPMFDVDSQDGNSDTWSFGKMVDEIGKGNPGFLEWDGFVPVPQFGTDAKRGGHGIEGVEETSFSGDSEADKDNDEKERCSSDKEENKSKNEEGSSEEEESGESDTEGEGSESGREEDGVEGSGKESELSGEETDEDTSSTGDASFTALLPHATGEVDDTHSAAAPVSLPTAAKEETPSGPQPMSQEEMEFAMAELQKAEEDLGESLIGWDDINNLLFNQWQDVQQMNNEDGDIV